MCGPEVLWDWLVLDISYVLVLVGGGMTLRARLSSPWVWMSFFALSASVGAFLFTATWQANVAGAAVVAGSTATFLAAAAKGGC